MPPPMIKSMGAITAWPMPPISAVVPRQHGGQGGFEDRLPGPGLPS